jgi:hypothetical protein
MTCDCEVEERDFFVGVRRACVQRQCVVCRVLGLGGAPPRAVRRAATFLFYHTFTIISRIACRNPTTGDSSL